jgi:hypothetical protein
MRLHSASAIESSVEAYAFASLGWQKRS